MRSKYPQDFIEDIQDMLDEELSVINVAWYLGAPEWLVKYVKNPEPTLKANREWRSRNLGHSLAQMREYSKRKNKSVDNSLAS